MEPLLSVNLSIVAGSMTVHGVPLSSVGPNLYRLEAEPALFLASDSDEEITFYPRYGDIIFTEAIDNRTLRYISVYERGPYKHYCYTLALAILEAPATTEFLQELAAEGGHWEGHMGGMLFLALPLSSSLDPESVLVGAGGA